MHVTTEVPPIEARNDTTLPDIIAVEDLFELP